MTSMDLTEKEAYAAMYAYLLMVYERTQSDDLAGLRGDMSKISEEETADPAVCFEWLDCVDKAKTGEVNLGLNLNN